MRRNVKIANLTANVSREIIQEMVDLIVEHFHPEKVILFGSYARGDENKNSDVDLMILLNQTPPEGKRSVPILRLLFEYFSEPIDVVVQTTTGFECWREILGSLAHRVVQEGIVLYEKTE